MTTDSVSDPHFPDAAISMADVAAALGCHQATVSRALRNHPRISPAMRDRVQAKCRELGYRPNPLVSALISSRKRPKGAQFQANIAYATRNPVAGPVAPGTYMEELFLGAQSRAEELGYLLEEVRLEELPPKAAGIDRVLKARGICGVIFGSMPPNVGQIIFPWEKYPVVAVGYGMKSPGLYRIATNNYESTYHGMEICRELGYRRAGFVISQHENNRSHGQEVGGFISYQMTLPEPDRVPILMAYGSECTKIQAWLLEHRPDVILSASPEKLLGICEQLGWNCPGNVGILALGNEAPPFFARMERSRPAIGHWAAEVLIRRIERNACGIPKNAGQYLINPTWRTGASIRRQK